jgi:hypothetical protein
MRDLMFRLLFHCLVLLSIGMFDGIKCGDFASAALNRITLCPGYIKRIECHGTLKFYSLGDPSLILAQAPSSSLGCVLYLRPLKKLGRTNLEIETSIGRSSAILEIIEPKGGGANCADKGQVI